MLGKPPAVLMHSHGKKRPRGSPGSQRSAVLCVLRVQKSSGAEKPTQAPLLFCSDAHSAVDPVGVRLCHRLILIITQPHQLVAQPLALSHWDGRVGDLSP